MIGAGPFDHPNRVTVTRVANGWVVTSMQPTPKGPAPTWSPTNEGPRGHCGGPPPLSPRYHVFTDYEKLIKFVGERMECPPETNLSAIGMLPEGEPLR